MVEPVRPTAMGPQKYKNETRSIYISVAIISVFFFFMCPAMGRANERKKIQNETEVRGKPAIQVCL